MKENSQLEVTTHDEAVIKQLNAQQCEIDLLQSELASKNIRIDKLEKDIHEWKNKYVLKCDEISSIVINRSTEKEKQFQSENENLHKNIQVLEDNLTSATKTILGDQQYLMELMERASKSAENLVQTEVEVSRLKETIIQLKEIVKNCKTTNIGNSPSYEKRAHTDVIILHDSLFKYINKGIMKNERLTTSKICAPRLDDAIQICQSLNENDASVICLHVSTNDLEHLPAETIAGKVEQIYQIVSKLNMKFVYSCTLPRNDCLEPKANLANAMAIDKLSNQKDAIISRNLNFFSLIDMDLFEDEVHLNPP